MAGCAGIVLMCARRNITLVTMWRCILKDFLLNASIVINLSKGEAASGCTNIAIKQSLVKLVNPRGLHRAGKSFKTSYYNPNHIKEMLMPKYHHYVMIP